MRMSYLFLVLKRSFIFSNMILYSYLPTVLYMLCVVLEKPASLSSQMSARRCVIWLPPDEAIAAVLCLDAQLLAEADAGRARVDAAVYSLGVWHGAARGQGTPPRAKAGYECAAVIGATTVGVVSRVEGLRRKSP